MRVGIISDTHDLLRQGSENRLKPGPDPSVSERLMKTVRKISFRFPIHIRQPFTVLFNPVVPADIYFDTEKADSCMIHSPARSQWKIRKLSGLSACGEITACNSLIPSCFLVGLQDNIQLRSGKNRRQETAETPWGPVRVKVSEGSGVVTAFTLHLVGGTSAMDDSFRGMRRAVRHLVELGHRDLIYFSEEIGDDKVLMDRYLGFWHAMYEYKLIDPMEIPGKVQFPEYGPEVLIRRIREGNVPDAVVCSSDETAALAERLLDEYSLRVPGDLSLTGYRSSDREEEEPHFSSCVIPLSLHAEKCLELMRKRITRGGTPDGARFLDCRFTNGTSTGEHKDSTVVVGEIYG